MSADKVDICIVGAGVVGLALACKITSHPELNNSSVLLLERNRLFGEETSSRNSEVIHAGIYYPPGSLKARLCIEGRRQLYAYCARRNIPHRQTGKLIIAQQAGEDKLHDIAANAERSGVDDLQPLVQNKIRKLEPAIRAHAALLSPSSGIIDSHAFMQSLLHEAEENGLVYAPLTEVLEVTRENNAFTVHCRCQDTAYRFQCRRLVNAAGLQAQALAKKIDGLPPGIIPEQQLVKGSYFTIAGTHHFRHLVYPLPEQNLQGLGIHLTLDMASAARFGPDAEPVKAIDYQVSPDRAELFRGAIRSYFPAIDRFELQPAYSGIRPKIAGSGIQDFVIQDPRTTGIPGLYQLFGIESPGLTASLAIADHVVADMLD